MVNNIVTLNNISKSFGGVRALKDVSFEINSGEIHALLGENGAGKSTLMKILSGALPKDGGKILVDGKEVHFKNTSDSKKLGIGIIYQEFSLVPDLSVAENIFLDKLNKNFWVNWKEIEKKTVYSIFSKPVSRSNFIVGKYLGLGATLLANVLIMGVGVSIAIGLS